MRPDATDRAVLADGTGEALRQPRVLGLVGALYVTQFLGFGFFTIALTGILLRGGASLSQVGLLNAVALIWPLKFLWAPVIDRFGSGRLGHYRTWLLVLQGGMVASLVVLSFIGDPVDHLAAVMVLVGLYVACSATQDIAADAVAVRMLRGGELGWGNGIQVAGGFLGNLIGGGLTVIVYDQFGWAPALLMLAAITAVALLLVWRFREPPRDPEPLPIGSTYAALFTVFREPGAVAWGLVIAPLIYSASAIANGLVVPALQRSGWSLTSIGVVTTLFAALPAVVAGVVAGGLVARFGRRTVLVVGGIALVLAGASLAPLMLGPVSTLYASLSVGAFMAAYTVTNVAIYVIFMQVARPTSAGTDFTILTCPALFVSTAAASLGLVAADALGLLPVLVIGVVLGVAGVGWGAVRLGRRA